MSWHPALQLRRNRSKTGAWWVRSPRRSSAMQPNARKPKVIIRHCDAYDPERIRAIVREGLEELDLRPRGRTLVKPNIVCAGEHFEHAHTRPEFVEGVLLALRDRDEGKMT